MIGILDYGAGNLKSVENTLERIFSRDTPLRGNPPNPLYQGGVSRNYFISDDPQELEKADKIIFPGVGHAKFAMQILKEKSLDVFLKNYKKPVLGICLGMQILFEFSEEDNTECLGIISGKVIKFDQNICSKVPHMGWNSVRDRGEEKIPLTQPLPEGEEKDFYFYFVHSYYVPVSEFTVLECDYEGQKFSASVQYKNFTGMQFHPEKSGKVGEEILREFLEN